MAKISKAVEEKVRDNIVAVVGNICDNALHISAITETNDIWQATAKLSDAEFAVIAGIPKTLWNSLERTQNNKWKDLVQSNFEMHIWQQEQKLINALEL